MPIAIQGSQLLPLVISNIHLAASTLKCSCKRKIGIRFVLGVVLYQEIDIHDDFYQFPPLPAPVPPTSSPPSQNECLRSELSLNQSCQISKLLQINDLKENLNLRTVALCNFKVKVTYMEEMIRK